MITLILTNFPEGPGKVWSCVMQNFCMYSPMVLIVSCSWHPNGAIEMFGIKLYRLTGKGRAKPLFTSLSMRSSRTFLFLMAD
jgi:hypothetical protein